MVFVGTAFCRTSFFVLAPAILIALAFFGGHLGIVGHLGGLVLGPNETAFDMKRSVHIDADESACDGNLGGIVDERLRHERRDLLIDRLDAGGDFIRSEENTSELQSLMRHSYAA